MTDYHHTPAFATLTVSNIRTSVRWYEQVAGFKVVYEIPAPDGEPVIVHLSRAEHQDVALAAVLPDLAFDMADVGSGVRLNFVANEDVDDLAKRARSIGATILEGPVDRAWDTREVVLSDPDGYVLVFSEQRD